MPRTHPLTKNKIKTIKSSLKMWRLFNVIVNLVDIKTIKIHKPMITQTFPFGYVLIMDSHHTFMHILALLFISYCSCPSVFIPINVDGSQKRSNFLLSCQGQGKSFSKFKAAWTINQGIFDSFKFTSHR